MPNCGCGDAIPSNIPAGIPPPIPTPSTTNRAIVPGGGCLARKQPTRCSADSHSDQDCDGRLLVIGALRLHALHGFNLRPAIDHSLRCAVQVEGIACQRIVVDPHQRAVHRIACIPLMHFERHTWRKVCDPRPVTLARRGRRSLCADRPQMPKQNANAIKDVRFILCSTPENVQRNAIVSGV